MRAFWVVATLLAGCESNQVSIPDAEAVDAPPDAPPFMCNAVAPKAPGPACLALDPMKLQGSTPLGQVAGSLDYFASGDCISHALATVRWTGACGEQIDLSFGYPTMTNGPKRFVQGSFDTDARFAMTPPMMARNEVLTSVHVDVADWREGDSVHTVDILVTITDARFDVPQIHIAGTFCDWPFYLC